MNAINNTKRILLLAAPILLTACASPGQIKLADGTLVHRIECAGSDLGLNYCLGRAGKTCGADGFTIVTDDGNTIVTSAFTDAQMADLVTLHAMDQNSLLVKCGT